MINISVWVSLSMSQAQTTKWINKKKENVVQWQHWRISYFFRRSHNSIRFFFNVPQGGPRGKQFTSTPMSSLRMPGLKSLSLFFLPLQKTIFNTFCMRWQYYSHGHTRHLLHHGTYNGHGIAESTMKFHLNVTSCIPTFVIIIKTLFPTSTLQLF